MPSGTGIAPPRCHPPPDGGTLRHVNNSLPGPVSEGLVHGNGSRQPDNWLSALAEPFVTILAHGNGVSLAMLEKANKIKIIKNVSFFWGEEGEPELRRPNLCLSAPKT